MSKQQQEHKTTEDARWMLEGSHGMARDAEAAVALLEEKVKDGEAEAMWMLGVCCEFGIGTEQDVERAEQLYKHGAEQGSSTAKLLTDKLKNNNGRGISKMNLCRWLKQTTEATKTKIGASNNVVVDREKLQSRGNKGAGLDAADARAANNAEPEL